MPLPVARAARLGHLAQPTQTAAAALFEPSSFRAFRFLSRELEPDGGVRLRYALDEELFFEERFELPLQRPVSERRRASVDGLLSLLHWVAGVSYYKTAAPPRVSLESGAPRAATAALLEALYSEGLGEFAYTNGLASLPRPRFSGGEGRSPDDGPPPAPADPAPSEPERVLVPVGGGKDSAVAIEVVRAAGVELALFSIGDAPPIARTVAVAQLPHLLARRRLDPQLAALNRAGALNGHVPVTAIVTCVALLTAALNGFDAVAMANERSASTGSLVWDGIEVNHQFSKGYRAERLLAAAEEELRSPVRSFSVLRPASELAVARTFARLERYHGAFTSCNAIFRLDPELRSSSWCGNCPKCRFVFLALAPFLAPAQLAAIFGADLLDDEQQLEGFALLCASGGHKPFECVGEEQESLAALSMLARDPRWRDHRVVAGLAPRLLGEGEADPEPVLALSGEHRVPRRLLGAAEQLLGAPA